jgi:hypothetical protein
LKEPLLKYFDAEAVTTYGVDDSRKEIFSKVTYGNKLGKIRVPLLEFDEGSDRKNFIY